MGRRPEPRGLAGPVRCLVCGCVRTGGEPCPRCGAEDDGARRGAWSLMPRALAAVLAAAVLLAVGAAVAAGVWAALRYG